MSNYRQYGVFVFRIVQQPNRHVAHKGDFMVEVVMVKQYSNQWTKQREGKISPGCPKSMPVSCISTSESAMTPAPFRRSFRTGRGQSPFRTGRGRSEQEEAAVKHVHMVLKEGR